MGKYIVGITGASGSIYAKKTVELLLKQSHHVYLCITPAARQVVNMELGWNLNNTEEEDEAYLQEIFQNKELVHCYSIRDIGAAIASGSFRMNGMLVVPCSMGTLSAICHGASDNLLERAADVCLKERRKLLLVPREAPYNQIHLENMLHLHRCGAIMMPASPGFYGRPKSLDEMAEFFAVRVLDQMGIEIKTDQRWG